MIPEQVLFSEISLENEMMIPKEVLLYIDKRSELNKLNIYYLIGFFYYILE